MDYNLVKEINMDDLPEPYSDIAPLIGIEKMVELANLFGGSYVYFPKTEAIERPIRNNRIRKEFNGYNFKTLSKKYNLTEIMIRTICEDLIKAERDKPLEGQLSLAND